MSDVLVYSGPGVSTSALHHTLKTLRTLLSTYDIKTVDARTLALDPWQKGTALVVLPGGRDLPYVSELARPFTRSTEAASSSSTGSERTACREIRNFVESGGNFLGICAENSHTEAQDSNDKEERDQQLRVHEQHRLQWMHELFTERLGLRSELPQWALASSAATSASKPAATGTAVETEEPKLLPIYLASLGDDKDSNKIVDKILQKLASEKTSGPVSHLQGFENCDALKTANIASVKDSNDAMHFSVADSQTILEAQSLCTSADYDAFSKPVIPTTASSEAAAEESTPDKEVDLDSVPKYILACKETRPTTEVLPYWNINEYEKHLSQFRSINLQNEQNKLAGHWSTYRPPYDPFSPFGPSSSSSSSSPAAQFGTPMLYTQMVTSTQTMLDKNFRLLSALPVGTTFFATQQMSGRGRGGNRWISPKGCLQFSAVFRVPVSMASKTVFLQYLSGLAVVEGIKLALGGSEAGRAVAGKVRIKWPNDIYAEIPPVDSSAGGERAKTATFELDGKRYAKLGGILVNSQFSGGNEFVLISGCGNLVKRKV
ncbi:hypothetical protein NDA16_000156 [Ustilago loliicola]|nr:hypothetical protein NDA16_000156 [Ustilago loliicola]